MKFLEGGRSKSWRIAENTALPPLGILGMRHKQRMGIVQGEIFEGG